MAASASALPLPAQPAVALAAPTEAARAPERPQLRQAPVPVCEPPFEDDSPDDPDGASPAGQAALALGFALPNGLPVSPDAPAALSRGTERRLQLVRPLERNPAPQLKRPDRKRRTVDDEFGPRRTPRADLPEPRLWAGRLVQALVEVTSGVRPAAQLVRWTTTDVYAALQRRIVRSELLGQRAPGARRLGAIVRSIHVDEPAEGVAEVCAVVQHGMRCRAIALRLEGFDGRWQCTALQVG